MGDRVLFLSGNQIVRDHAYWPVISYDQAVAFFVGLGMSEIDAENEVAHVWPIEVLPAEYMRLAWGIKQWDLTGNFHFEGNHTGNDYVEWTMDASTSDPLLVQMYQIPPDGDDEDSVPITREREILGPTRDRGVGNDFVPSWDVMASKWIRNVGHYIENDNMSDDNPGADIFYNFGFGGGLSDVFLTKYSDWFAQIFRPEIPVIWEPDDQKFLIPINLSISGIANGDGGLHGPALLSATAETARVGDDIIGTLTIDTGVDTYEIDLSLSVSRSDHPQVGDISGTIDVTIEATDFWAYG